MGLWSDGTTMWVADNSDDKIYAYDLAAGARRSKPRHQHPGCRRQQQSRWPVV